jgi:hypothetical protein
MTNDSDPEFVIDLGNGPRYDHAALAAAEILRLDYSQPKAVLFGLILFTVLDSMNRAEEERTAAHSQSVRD